MTGWLSRHFSDTKRRATAEQLQREQFLYGSVPFQRWLLIPASVFSQLAAGSFYAWSVYNGPITHRMNEGYDDEHVSKELISETFYAAVFAFGAACLLCGPWLERYGPRTMTIIGGTFFFVGQMLSAIAMLIQSVPLLFIGFGAIGGFGIGCSYLIPVAVLQQWYPESKGFSAGVAVGSFGLGSVLASFTQAALLESMGPMWTFIVLGCVYYGVQILSALILRFPSSSSHLSKSHHEHHAHLIHKSGAAEPSSATHPSTDVEAGEPHGNAGLHRQPSMASSVHVANPDEFMTDIKSVDYRLIYFIFFLSVIPGLVIVSRVADMVQSVFGKPVATSTWVVGVNGAFNVIGRFAMGILSDKVPRIGLLLSTIILTICILITLFISLNSLLFELFIFSMWALTGLYGGACAVIPGIIGDVFGSAHIGALYGVALTAWAGGGVIGGVGFTAIINWQRHSGVAANHVYDICIFSMLPLAAVGVMVIAGFIVRRRRHPAFDLKAVNLNAH